jgi:hypothetical protein
MYGSVLIKLEFSQQIFEKYCNIKFHKNPVQWEQSRSMPTDSETDRHAEANRRFSQFFQRAY